jgi:hypothetical protein
VNDTLTRNADGTFALWSKQDRLTYTFDSDGVLKNEGDVVEIFHLPEVIRN